MICPNCSSNDVNLYCKIPPIIFDKNYKIKLCNKCGIGFTSPLPSIGEDHYEEAVRPEIISAEIVDAYKKELSYVIHEFKREFGRNPKNFLDIGCGNGLMLRCAEELGLQVMGIEPSRGMCQHVEEQGLSVTNCRLESFDDYNKYDLLVLNSVIEHLPNPIQTLNFLRAKVKSDSFVVFQQAVFDGLIPKLFRWVWYGWSPAEHFCHYTEKSFSEFVEGNGFLVVKTKRTNLYYEFYLGSSWRTWKTFIYSNVLKLTSLLAGVINRGDSLTVFTRKK